MSLELNPSQIPSPQRINKSRSLPTPSVNQQQIKRNVQIQDQVDLNLKQRLEQLKKPSSTKSQSSKIISEERLENIRRPHTTPQKLLANLKKGLANLAIDIDSDKIASNTVPKVKESIKHYR